MGEKDPAAVSEKMQDWERFILTYGWNAFGYELAAVLGKSVEDVERVRRTHAGTRLTKVKRFAELMSLWHGRPPKDVEWQPPRKSGGCGYEWLPPETALLASLVGLIDKSEISKILTRRLRAITGNRRAARSPNSVQSCMQRIGMQSNDVVGGITSKAAAREINSYAIVFQSIKSKVLRARRVGRLWVIPREAWKEFKAKRVFPPKGYIQLSSIRQALGIRSDAKLPDWASRGHIPTAVRCNPFGSHGTLTRGTWYVDPKVAKKLVADRRLGRPMPWHGKPDPGNLGVTFKLWRKRQHPPACRTCAEIWGRAGAPRSYDDYALRYPPLAHGAKRHLTRPWSPGLPLQEVAMHVGCGFIRVREALKNGMLEATRSGRFVYISKTEATRWKARRCPTGTNELSWLSIDTASKQYLFTAPEIHAFIRSGALSSKVGTNGPMRGITYVARAGCARLRERIGFKEVQAVIKRLQSEEGYTIDDAAEKLEVTTEWIHERILDGTIRVARAKWDRRRIYITEPMFQRLRREKKNPTKRERFNGDWLLLTQAANEGGVCTTTIIRWQEEGALQRRHSLAGWRYLRSTVRARARRYWKTVRFLRATPPAWLRPQAAANDDVLRVAA